MQNLYDFTQDAMKLAATGRVEDLAAWTSADYNIRFLNLVQTRRPMVRRTMGNVDLTKVHMGGQPLPPAPAPARKRRSEGMLLFFTIRYDSPLSKRVNLSSHVVLFFVVLFLNRPFLTDVGCAVLSCPVPFYTKKKQCLSARRMSLAA